MRSEGWGQGAGEECHYSVLNISGGSFVHLLFVASKLLLLNDAFLGIVNPL